MGALGKPNLILPLAESYNTRGMAAFSNVYTSGIDQRKVNSIYEPVTNSVTHQTTLYVAKRPGMTLQSGSFGTSGQVAYLTCTAPANNGLGANSQWVFSVSGNDIRASSTGTTTVVYTNSGTSYAPAFVSKTLISGAETLVLQIENSLNSQLVFYSTAIGTFTQITDGDFLGPIGKMEFMDGFSFYIHPNDLYIYNSDLNSISSWNPSNFIAKQIQTDIPVGLAKFGNQILAFGLESMEVFRNAGYATGSPLETVQQLAQRVGMHARRTAGMTHYTAMSGNRLYFYGNRSGYLGSGVFAWDGSQMAKVSSTAIDKILASATEVYSVNAYNFQGKEAVAFALDPTTATTQRWLMYFPAWNDWFEWNSTVHTPVGLNGFKLGVGSNQHKLYQHGVADNWQDDGTDYTMTHQFRIPTQGNNPIVMSMCGLVADTARSALTVNTSFSDDDGQNFSAARGIDMTQAEKHLYRCGMYCNRTVRLTNASNAEGRMEKFIAIVK